MRHDGTFPSEIEHEYDAALVDDDARRRFDPRADWDSWTTGKDPFARRVKLFHTPALGVSFLDHLLLARFKSRFAHLWVDLSKEFLGPTKFEAEMINQVKQNYFESWLVPTKRCTNGEEEFLWIKKQE